MNKGAKALWCFTLLLLMIGMAGIIAGAVGDAWWVDSDTDIMSGLWRHCLKDNCTQRIGFLEFEEKKTDKDVILVVLIVSAAVTFFAIINLLSLICCRKDEDNWKCGSLILTLLSFSGAVAGIGSMIYSEIQFKTEWDENDHGWSALLAWIGACSLFIAFILSFFLICNAPEYENKGFSMESRANNKGYELS